MATGSPSADKPRASSWFNDGSWWGLLRSPGRPVTIHRLGANHAWTNTGVVVDDRAASTGDALWTGSKLYVASRVTGGALRVIKMSYNATTDVYSMDAGFPKQVGSNGSESISIARDTLGQFWITFTQGSRVFVAHSTTSDTTWTAPFIIPTGDTTLSADDISAVIAFSGRVGHVLRPAERRHALRRPRRRRPRLVVDQRDRPVRAGTGRRPHQPQVDRPGRRRPDYAATKTSRGDAGEPGTDPLIYVLTRSSTGTWSTAVAGRVADDLTRPQLAIDTTNRMLYIVMTSPDTGGGGIVYYKRSPLGATLSFPTGKGSPFVSWPGVRLNNPTTTKDPVNATTGLVVLATDDTNHRYYHAELSLGAPTTPPPDTTAPTAPTGVQATATSATSVSLTWTASTDAVGVTGYRVFRNGAQVGTAAGTSFTDSTAAASTTYSYTVAAVDAAANVSGQSTPPATVTTPAGGGTPPPVGTVTFVGAATATGTTTTVAAGSPTGVAAGDVLVAAVTVRGAPTITPPAGWTQVRVDSNATTVRQAVFVRTATGASEGSTWRLSGAQTSVVQVVAYRGVAATSPVVGSAGVTGTGTTITSPAAPAVAGAAVLTFAGTASATSLTPTAPLTERSEQTSGTTPQFKVSADSGAPRRPARPPGRSPPRPAPVPRPSGRR